MPGFVAGARGGINTDDPWVTQDGRLNAPAQGFTNSTLVNQYVASGAPLRVRIVNGSYDILVPGNARRQPPWMIAGVDYPVGIDRAIYPNNGTLGLDKLIGTRLGDPAVAFAGLISGSAGNGNLITFTGPMTVDGYDFSLSNTFGNGYTITANGNVNFTNCLFKQTTTNKMPFFLTGNSPAGAVSIKYCEFDGNSGAVTTLAGAGYYQGIFKSGGPYELMYCYFHNAAVRFWEWSKDVGGATNETTTVKYCFFQDNCNARSSGLHGNGFLDAGASLNLTLIFQYNVFYMSDFPPFIGGGQNHIFFAQNQYSNSYFTNNVVMALPFTSPQRSYTLTTTAATLNGTAAVLHFGAGNLAPNMRVLSQVVVAGNPFTGSGPWDVRSFDDTTGDVVVEDVTSTPATATSNILIGTVVTFNNSNFNQFLSIDYADFLSSMTCGNNFVDMRGSSIVGQAAQGREVAIGVVTAGSYDINGKSPNFIKPRSINMNSGATDSLNTGSPTFPLWVCGT
jgi:hypothetical protein